MDGPPARRWSPRRWLIFLTARARQSGRRVLGSAVPLLHSSLAATLAWLIAHYLLGRSTPLFAPIAAYICLGFKIDRVPRKVVELGLGATAGVFIGEWFAQWLSIGWWEIFVVLFLASAVGRLLDRGDLTTIQAGVNAVFILGMSWWQAAHGGVHNRWIDSLVGAGVAFVFSALLPRRPTSRPRRYARATLSELATWLEMIGRGLSTGDTELLTDARGQGRAVTEVRTAWEETLLTAREVVTYNPTLWTRRGEVAELDRLFRLTGRAQRTAGMLGRQGLAMTEEVGHVPHVGDLLVEAAHAAHALAGSVGSWNRPIRAREVLIDIAGRATPSEIAGDDWRPVALMSLLRALTVDLLQLTGLSRDAARAALTDTWGRPFGEPLPEVPDDESDDDASPTWG